MVKLRSIDEKIIDISEDIIDKYCYLGSATLDSDDMEELLCCELGMMNVKVLKCKNIDHDYVEKIATYKIKYTLKD